MHKVRWVCGDYQILPEGKIPAFQDFELGLLRICWDYWNQLDPDQQLMATVAAKLGIRVTFINTLEERLFNELVSPERTDRST